jgi:hypothetical protein
MHPRIRQFIAGLQIGGGFVGMALASTSTAASGLSLFQRVYTGLLGIPFALAVYAGRALWQGQSRGYLLSMAVQAAQIPAWSSHTVLYVFYCGAQLGFWFGRTRTAPLWGFGSRFTWNVLEYPRGEALGINFLALLALILLVVGWCRVKQTTPRSSYAPFESAEPRIP